MTNITFFFLLIPFLALALLMVNFIFASHTPYQEKNSTFECGFHSFLGQNRMQFNISFYIFGLLFLLFDLEILLIYPYPVSIQFNSLYGLIIMLIFFLILTLGFTFELGKNALKIDSRQYDNNNTTYKSDNKLLTSGLFNNPKDFFYSILSGLLVLIFFTFALKYLVLSFNSVIVCLISGIISIWALLLKSIIKPCLMNDIKKIKDISDNKKKFLYEILIRFMISIIITYIIIFILAYFNISSEVHEIFFGVLMCEDFLYQEWIDPVDRVDADLSNPRSRIMNSYNITKEFDEKFSIIKRIAAEQLAAAKGDNSLATQTRLADNQESINMMQYLLDDQFSEFSKIRGDVRRSVDRVRQKFESLPDSHDGKKYYLDRIYRQRSIVTSLGENFENKKIRPTPQQSR